MEMVGRIRRMHRRDKKSVREIARATGLSRNTRQVGGAAGIRWCRHPVGVARATISGELGNACLRRPVRDHLYS